MQVGKSILTLFVALLPFLILVFGRVWPVKDAGDTVKARPPAKVFLWAWIIVCTSSAVSWALIIWKSSDNGLIKVSFVAYVLFIAGAVVWLYLYHKGKKKEAAWMLGATSLCALWALVCCIRSNTASAIFMSITLIWCLFATILNVIEVQVDGTEKIV